MEPAQTAFLLLLTRVHDWAAVTTAWPWAYFHGEFLFFLLSLGKFRPLAAVFMMINQLLLYFWYLLC